MMIILLLGVVLSTAFANPPIPEGAKDLFKQIDGNKDGLITLAEFKSFYDTFDVDGDGHIDLKSYIEVTHLPVDQATYLFHEYDMDKDNDLTKADVDIFFKGFDTNGNGQISFAEFDRYVHYKPAVGK